jgi:type II secretory pathway pseudopilin PulG
MARSQRGFTLTGALSGMIVLALVGLLGAKLFPSYVEYYGVKKIIAAMEQNGELQGTVKQIRQAFDRRNAIEDVKSVTGDDLDITKEGGEAVVTATWSVKVPVVGNVNACVDFSVTTAK